MRVAVYRAFLRFLEVLLLILTFAAVGVLVLQVLFRNVINQALFWSDELARYLLVWITFVGGVVALARRRHIAFEGLVDFLPRRARIAVGIVADLILFAFLGVLTVTGAQLVLSATNYSITLPIRMSYVYAVVPFAGAAMMLVMVMQVVEARRATASDRSRGAGCGEGQREKVAG